MTMNDLTTVAQEFLTECREDYVGLWVLVRRIRRAGATDDSNMLETSLTLLEPLLSERKIIAGEFVRDDRSHSGPLEGYEFRQWQMPPQEVIARIKDEWTKLARDPNLGEIVWFTLALAEK